MMNNNFFYRHTKRMVVALVASACALSLTVLPALAADENTTPTQEEIFKQRCENPDPNIPKNYFWVSTENKKLLKIEIAPDFKSGKVEGNFADVKTPAKYGDIAVLPNYKSVYGVEFIWGKNIRTKYATRLVKHSDQNGSVEWSKALVGNAGNGTAEFSFSGSYYKERPYGKSKISLNGLSFGPGGTTLLAGSPNNSNIYEILPEDSAATNKTVPIIKLDATFPNGLVSGGDFIILPDGSLLGLAYGDPSILVKWDADKNGQWHGDGAVIGKVPAAYGMARVGGHILLPGIDSSNGLVIYVVDVNGAQDGNGLLPYSSFIVSLEADIAGKDIFGASSSGDGGLSDDEGYLDVKTVFSNDEKQSDGSSTYPSGRKHKDDQVTLSSEDYCAGGQFAASAGTSGSNAGLQQDSTGVDIAHTEFVVKGTWHTVSEDFANATLAQELGKASVNRLPFYDVALTCEAIHPDGTSEQLTTGPISVTATRASADVQVSNISGARTVCTFTNTPIERPRAFPLTGATTNGWQLLGAVGVLAAFAVFPVVSVVRKRKVQ